MTGSERFALLAEIGWTIRQFGAEFGYSQSGAARWFDDRPGKRATPHPAIDDWLTETARVMSERRQRSNAIRAKLG